MELEISYQVIINLVGTALTYAVPIGVIFAMAEKLVNLFFSMAFGSKNVKM